MSLTTQQTAAHRAAKAIALAWSVLQTRYQAQKWVKKAAAAVTALEEAVVTGDGWNTKTLEGLTRTFREVHSLPDVSAFLAAAERALMSDYTEAERSLAKAWGLVSGCESEAECTLRFGALLNENQTGQSVSGPAIITNGVEWVGTLPNPQRSVAAAIAVGMTSDLVLPMLAGACNDGSAAWKRLDEDVRGIVAAVKQYPRGIPIHRRTRLGAAALEAEWKNGDVLPWLPGEMLTLKARASWADKLPAMRLPKDVFLLATRKLGTAAVQLLESPQAFESTVTMQAVKEAFDAWVLMNPLCYTERAACTERFRAKWRPAAEKEVAAIKPAEASRKTAQLRLAVVRDTQTTGLFGYANSWHLPGQNVLKRQAGVVRTSDEASAWVHAALSAIKRITAPMNAALLWGYTQPHIVRPAVEAALRELAQRDPKLAELRFHEAEPLVSASKELVVTNVREHVELDREAQQALDRHRSGIQPVEEALVP